MTDSGSLKSLSSSADILIVDDRIENLRLLAEMLTHEGYQVRKAISGAMALQSVHNLTPDLVLLDIMMPQLDGYEVCRQLKANQRTREIPVIFISALNEGFDKAKAFGVGGADYITKPFQLEELLARVKQQLQLRSAQHMILNINANLEKQIEERTQQLQIANELLQTIAYYDRLTGLANRNLFLKQLASAIQQEAHSSKGFAVLFIDCDRFKLVNDSLGHDIGDQLLQAISLRLKTSLPNQSLLARLGGDEFAMLLSEAEESRIIAFSKTLLAVFEAPFVIDGYCLFANASIGIALSRQAYHQPEQILRDADIAMYRAKGPGSLKYCIFDRKMRGEAINRLVLERDLRQAMHDQALALYFQPIINLQTGQLHALEALARWFSSQRGSVSPEVFIRVAEETGLIYDIEHWVLETACCQLDHWQRQQLVSAGMRIHINLSSHHLTQPTLLQEVSDILKQLKLRPGCLGIEITESAIIGDLEGPNLTLQALQAQSMTVSIDDFGTGYSSLSYLRRLPINNLKIDKSFVKSLETSPSDRDIISAIMGIARGMGFSVTAEGIETPGHLACLQDLGCDFGQGNLFAEPLDAGRLEQWLQAWPGGDSIETLKTSFPI